MDRAVDILRITPRSSRPSSSLLHQPGGGGGMVKDLVRGGRPLGHLAQNRRRVASRASWGGPDFALTFAYRQSTSSVDDMRIVCPRASPVAEAVADDDADADDDLVDSGSVAPIRARIERIYQIMLI
jgi:hypothetical protein